MKSRNIILFASILMVTAIVGKILAQTTTPAHPDTRNRVNESPRSMSSDAVFMKTLAIGGIAEVEAGTLATSKAGNKEVKHFAERMVNEHSKNNEQLKALAKEKLVDLPTVVDADHAATQAKLEQESGSDFDAEYMKSQVRDHRKTAQLLKREINDGQDAEIKAFAQETLTVVRHHLEMARDLQAKISHSSH
ncbi:MAG: DUF4142 domain-containing protein [Steroidobacter sp.]